MSTILKPFGNNDPYSEIELIASTHLVDTTKFSIDQMPVLAARVSHSQAGKTGDDIEADDKLITFLVNHFHWSVFEHMSVTFRVCAPLFVIREMQRHRSFSFNEESMRYSSDPVGKFYTPQLFREQATRNKQGSAGPIRHQTAAHDVMKASYEQSLKAYNELLQLNVCREQARAVIPVGNYSTMYMTGNLRSWTHFCNLRVAEDAQWEIRQYANLFDDTLLGLYPHTWGALRELFEQKKS